MKLLLARLPSRLDADDPLIIEEMAALNRAGNTEAVSTMLAMLSDLHEHGRTSTSGGGRRMTMGKTKWQVREALGLTKLPDDELMRLLEEAGEEESVAGGVPVNGDGYPLQSIRDALVRRSVGEALAAARAETGSSLRGAGNASGLSHTRIQQIEASINVEVATVVRVAAALGYGVKIVLEPKPDGAGGARTVTADLTGLA